MQLNAVGESTYARGGHGIFGQPKVNIHLLTLLHSERPKLYTILAFLSAIGLNKNYFELKCNIIVKCQL